MRLSLGSWIVLAACSGAADQAYQIDTSQPSALPMAGTYRAVFEGEFSACDVGIVNDRFLSVRQQYVLVLPEDAQPEAQLSVENVVGDQLYSCVRDLSEGTYYCGVVFDQHIGDDSNTYSWSLVHRFDFADSTSGTMTIDTEVTCVGTTCPYETCSDAARYEVALFDQFEPLTQQSCTNPPLPAQAWEESLLEVRNLNSQPVDLVWVDWEGTLRAQQTLAPGQTNRQRVFAGHAWQARVGSTCLGTWVSTNQIGQFDIP